MDSAGVTRTPERERHAPWVMTHRDTVTPRDTVAKWTAMTTTMLLLHSLTRARRVLGSAIMTTFAAHLGTTGSA